MYLYGWQFLFETAFVIIIPVNPDSMIDKQQFENFYQYFTREEIVEIIEIFPEQQPEIINALALNIENHDLVKVKLNAHKLKGPMLQFYDPVASKHAQVMEDAALRKIIEIVDSFIGEYPEPVRAKRLEFDDYDLFRKQIVPAQTLKAYLTGLTGSLSPEAEMRLRELEIMKMADGMHKMLADLKYSSSLLAEELKQMKLDLTA